MSHPERSARARSEEETMRPLAVGSESEFRVDLERLRFAPSFARLAEVTQVVTSGATGGVVHNRMTHSIKVTAVARAIAVHLLRTQDPEVLDSMGGLHHVVAQAAAVAHDVGHPPFGHLGEHILDRLGREHFGLSDGYEGNAQSFRLITELEVHGPGTDGLNLTAAVRASILKYPWGRQVVPSPHPSTWLTMPRGAGPGEAAGSTKFNAYLPDLTELIEVREAFPMVPAGRQTLECAVMDLADDIAYSLHDLEDFHRSGVLQYSATSREFRRWLHERTEWRLLSEDALAQRARTPGAGLETLRRRLAEKDDWIFTEEAFMDAVARIADEFIEPVLGTPYDGSMLADRAISGFLSVWIDHFIESVQLEPDPHVRSAYVHLDTMAWHEVQVLKFVHQYFVLHRPDLAMYQRGQATLLRQVVRALDAWLSDRHDIDRAPRRLVDLVATAQDGYRKVAREYPEWLSGQTSETELTRMARGRGILDFVSSLTDSQVFSYAGRLSGSAQALWTGGGV
ncbi:dGTP triphosphohydrolase [Enemella sp. A6]|uniref:dGTP triphosphohydrolase n=1 Tax=Enemella sp. A6 TaxID=3440152 RepID=UPI003EBC3136